jgi:HEAT repeat protein
VSSQAVDEAIRAAAEALARLTLPALPEDDFAAAVAAFRRACAALAALGASATDSLTRLLNSPEPQDFARAQTAARVLAELGDPAAARALLDAARSADLTRAFRAWFALRLLRRTPESYALLADAAMASPPPADPQRRAGLEQLADALVRQLHPARYDEVAAWAAAHDNAQVRAAVVKALARWGGPEAVPHLRAALTDREPAVSLWAAFGLLWEVEDEAALQALLAAPKAKQKKPRAEAVALLGWLPAPAAVAPLLEATRDAGEAIRLAAIVGAGNAGVRQSVLALAGLLDHASAATAEQAAAVLPQLVGRDLDYQWEGRKLTRDCVERVRRLCRETDRKSVV